MSNTPAPINDNEIIDLPPSRTHTNLLQVVWQRKSLVILGIIIGMVGGLLYFGQRAPTFMSFAHVLVVKKSPEGLGSDPTRTMMEDYMSTQSMVLKSEVVAERAANMMEIKQKIESGTLKSFPDATQVRDVTYGIMNAVTITRENKEGASQGGAGNNVLILGFKGIDANECEMFLRCLIKGYQDYLDDIYKSQSDQFIEMVNKARSTLDDKLRKAHEALQKFNRENTVTVSKINGGLSETQKTYEVLSTQLAVNKEKLTVAQADYETFKNLYETKGPQETIAAIMASDKRSLFNADSEVEKEILRLLIKKDQLLANVGPNHPEVKAINQQIEAIRRNFFKKPSDGPLKDAGEPELDAAALFVRGLKSSVERLTKLIAELSAAYMEVEKKIQDANSAIFEEDALKDAVNETRRLLMIVTNRIEQIDLTKGGGYKADAITRRAGIGRRVAPMPFQVFTAAGLLGTLLGIGLAYLAEISDKSFRNPVEIRRRLGLPVIGHVPYLAADDKAKSIVEGGSATVDPMLITHYQSNSIGAEAYRGVRTALYFSTRGEAHKVIQVTSPNVSDGKSTLAANLAVSIAQSGKRTLLIDADFRKPRVHRIFNVPATVGMASVILGQSELAGAIQQTAVPNLSVLPCGPRPANPAELLTSPKFKELLDELRTQFDFVIVDTPPILVVTDPAVVAPRVDGVILCIRVTKNGRPFAERAREVLASLGANVIGVVVNGFGAQVGGGKYGYEHYQYGYGEGYTYGYTYADKEAESYYGGQADEPPALTEK